MSRIGKKPIPIPSGVEVSISRGSVTVKGPKGELSERINPEITVSQDDGTVTVTRPSVSASLESVIACVLVRDMEEAARV